MPNFPFYFEAKDEQSRLACVDLTDDQQKKRRNDHEVIGGMRRHQKRYFEEWRQGGRTYNVIQDGSSDDRVSNIYIGLARMIIDAGISMMTEGEADFDFAPLGPSDHKKIILWRGVVKMLLNQCGFRAHQDRFVTDFFVFGTGVYEVYTQMPFRKRRYEREDGSIEEKIVRDFRRPKVGVRHLSPFYCFRSPNVSDPDDVSVAGKRDVLTYDQFVQNFANVTTASGEPKYDKKVIAQLLASTPSHVQTLTFFDEIQDAFRVYALPFGTTPESEAAALPEEEIGVPIFDKPLSISRVRSSGYRSSGANVQGLAPLCFGVNNVQYDRSFQTQAIYGMGIPRLIEGPEMAMEAMFNMTLDNLRLQNTVTLNYRPNDGKTGIDLNNTSFYSGMFLDGEVVATPWGQARLSDNSLFWNWLNQLCIWITGINFQNLVGDTSKTAFEFSQRIRANNQRAEKRIRSLENGCLKRMGTLLLSNALSELTVEEWEDLTEEQAESIAERIASGETTAEDYKDYVDGKPTKRRVHFYIPLRGHKLREDFRITKKRKLDYHSTKNTLVEDSAMEGETAYVPIVPEYLYPVEYIESGLLPDVIVDGKRMLGDLKVQDTQVLKTVGDYFRTRLAETNGVPGMENQVPNIDMRKLDAEFLKVAGIDERKVTRGGEEKSPVLSSVEKAIDDMENPHSAYEKLSPFSSVPIPKAHAGGSGSLSPEVPLPSNAFQRAAEGTL